jgi:hypothetical protein
MSAVISRPVDVCAENVAALHGELHRLNEIEPRARYSPSYDARKWGCARTRVQMLLSSLSEPERLSDEAREMFGVWAREVRGRVDRLCREYEAPHETCSVCGAAEATYRPGGTCALCFYAVNVGFEHEECWR